MTLYTCPFVFDKKAVHLRRYILAEIMYVQTTYIRPPPDKLRMYISPQPNLPTGDEGEGVKKGLHNQISLRII